MKICVITAARSDYDRLCYLIRTMLKHPDMQVDIVPIHMHLSPEYGLTVRQIEEDGFPVADCVEMLLSSATDVGASKSIGVGIIGLSDVLRRLSPDLVMVLGDRSELLSVASVCICQRIPLAHLCGGEITEGAIDDQVRHMLTKAAHLHFAANRTFGNRILQMGEEDWRVCVSGSPALDDIQDLPFLSRQELERDLDIDLSSKTALVTYHPVTLEHVDLKTRMRDIVQAMACRNLHYVITYPNADAGSDVIVQAFQEFAAGNEKRVRFVKNLGRLRYLSLMRCVCMVIGNSSSGIVEAPSFNVPVVNIGNRQTGRVFGSNVIQADDTRASIAGAIDRALAYARPSCENPYGDMKASGRIVAFMENVFLTRGKRRILWKKFVDR